MTAAEFWSMYCRGELAEMRVELIGGEMREWPPRSNGHGASIAMIEDVLEAIFDTERFWVRSRGTLDLPADSVVDPDVSVVTGSMQTWVTRPNVPTTAVLIVEVAEESFDFDRTCKASLYAAAGIADYWIVNIPDRQLEIRRDPQADATQDFGHGYATLTTLRPGDFAIPLAMPTARVAVADLLPN